MATEIDLKYLAPVPAGHEVLVLWTEVRGLLGGWSDSDPLVLDRGAGILYGPEWTPVELHGGDVELERHSGGDRRLSSTRPPLAARVVTCLVRSKGWGDYNDFSTRLGVEPLGAQGAYR